MLFFISINLESLKMSNKIQSEVWKHFDEISGSKNVKCKMAGDILVVKANLDKVLLGPSIEPDQDDENEKSDDDF